MCRAYGENYNSYKQNPVLKEEEDDWFIFGNDLQSGIFHGMEDQVNCYQGFLHEVFDKPFSTYTAATLPYRVLSSGPECYSVLKCGNLQVNERTQNPDCGYGAYRLLARIRYGRWKFVKGWDYFNKQQAVQLGIL